MVHLLVAIEDLGEYIRCLDTSKMNKNNECPLVTWSYYDKDGIVFSDNNFYTYFMGQIEDCL